MDMEAEKNVHNAVLAAIDARIVRSAHDCADGGLAVALAESCIIGNLGAEIELEKAPRASVTLFAESQSRIILSLSADYVDKVKKIAADNDVEADVIGQVGGSRLSISSDDQKLVDCEVSELGGAWRNAISSIMEETEVE